MRPYPAIPKTIIESSTSGVEEWLGSALELPAADPVAGDSRSVVWCPMIKRQGPLTGQFTGGPAPSAAEVPSGSAAESKITAILMGHAHEEVGRRRQCFAGAGLLRLGTFDASRHALDRLAGPIPQLLAALSAHGGVATHSLDQRSGSGEGTGCRRPGRSVEVAFQGGG